MSSSRCSSSEVSTQQTYKPSNSHVSPGSGSSSGNAVKPVSPPRRGQVRVDCHELSSASTITGNNDSTVSEATSVDRLSRSNPSEKEACSLIFDKDPPAQFASVFVRWVGLVSIRSSILYLISVLYFSLSKFSQVPDTSTNKSPASKEVPWPMWTVYCMMTLSTPAKVISHYRALNLADHLNDKDLRCFLDEQLCKEKAGLSEITISRRLRTRVMVTVGENPETCSICMVEFEVEDIVASLYYCSHEYHANCIKEWLRKCNLCPMCRALAIIPENYPSWEADVKLHQAYFVHLQHSVS